MPSFRKISRYLAIRKMTFLPVIFYIAIIEANCHFISPMFLKAFLCLRYQPIKSTFLRLSMAILWESAIWGVEQRAWIPPSDFPWLFSRQLCIDNSKISVFIQGPSAADRTGELLHKSRSSGSHPLSQSSTLVELRNCGKWGMRIIVPWFICSDRLAWKMIVKESAVFQPRHEGWNFWNTPEGRAQRSTACIKLVCCLGFRCGWYNTFPKAQLLSH